MSPVLKRHLALLRNRQGVAFPVALLGIMGVSVTITAVLLTATTETALSSAHQDATRDFYIAQGGLEAYVAEVGMGLTPVTNFTYLAPGAPASDQTLITVRQLASVPPNDPAAQPNWLNDLIFSIESRALRGGRTIAATARIDSRTLTLRNNVQAAVVSGSNVSLGGNTTVSDTTDRRLCADTAQFALQVDSANTISKTNNVTISGSTGKLGSDTDAYLNDMIGTTLTDLKNNATIHFSRTKPLGLFSGNTTVSSFATGQTANVANRTNHELTAYNWGCPADLLRLASANNSNKPCELDTDTLHMPIIAIDASKSDGSFGAVSLNLEHGQGILVVYNGDLNIQGQLAFKGLVIVEGAFSILGSGNNGARFEGSVIGLGKTSSGSSVQEDPNTTGGTPTIRYNRCAIDQVMNVFNNTNAFQRVTPPTSAWYEVVR